MVILQKKKKKNCRSLNELQILEQGCPNFGLTRATFEEKNCFGPRIKYYNSFDICYSKKIVNNVEIRTLLFF